MTFKEEFKPSGQNRQKKQCIFDNIALYFKCGIDKNALIQTVFFDDFAHWERSLNWLFVLIL